ncbi:MAG: thiolase domain-containing protein [Nitrososphaerota archaeon]
MAGVYVAGVGFTKIAEHWDRDLEHLMAEAAIKAMEDAGVSSVNAIYVGCALSEPIQGQMNLGALMAECAGLVGAPALRMEAAEASGAAALYAGFCDVASGRSEAVLVVGGEKLSDGLSEEVSSGMMMSGRSWYEGFMGADFYALNALLYRLYSKRYGEEGIPFFPVISHEHAEGVSHAQYPFKISLDRVLESPFIADPLRMLEVSGIGDGAAAVILVNEDLARRLSSPKARIYISSATDYVNPFDREDPLRLQSVLLAVNKVLEQARASRSEISMIELHDATSILAALCLESGGFSPPGEAGKLAMKGEFSLSGRLPCNTFGGLKARGHPFGATALYQVAEIYLQLAERAGKNQLDNPRVGLTLSLSGVGAAAFASLLKKE